MSYIDIVIEKHYEGWTAMQIYNYLKEIFKCKAPAYPTITKKIRSLSFYPPIEGPNKEDDIRLHFDKIFIVECYIKGNPNASIRNISEDTKIPPTSVYRYLTQHLHYFCLHLRWIPHDLTDELRNVRIEYSQQLLTVLQQAEKKISTSL